MKRKIFFISFGIGVFSPWVYAQDIRDVKPPVDPPPNYFVTGALLFILFIAILLVFFVIRKLRKPGPIAVLPAWQIAANELARLKAENLPGQGKVKEFYTRLSDILRHYLEAQLNIRAPEMTTPEFFMYIKQTTEFSEEQKKALKNFLDCCDMVKFAKYASNIQEIEESFALANRLVEEIKEKNKTPLPA